MSEFSYYFDGMQYFFYEAMGGGGEAAYSQQIVDSFAKIESNTANFASFVGDGEGHCILPMKAFYTEEKDGVRFVDWVNELVSKGSVDSVM